MTPADTLARCEDVLAYKPHVEYAMGSGPSEPSKPWHDPKSDCSSFGCYCLGVAKHDPVLKNAKGEHIWWGTAAIVADATGPQRRWRKVETIGPDAPVGALVVYPTKDGKTGHCGIIRSGTIRRPFTFECRGTLGAWFGQRPDKFWTGKKAIFCVPVGA